MRSVKTKWGRRMRYGTMAAKQSSRKDSGQSIVEFLIMLPLLVGLTVVLLRVNSLIQISIVNQQYARAQALWIAFNSPVYPPVYSQGRPLRKSAMEEKEYNRMVIGISENQPDGEDGSYTPETQTQMIARTKAKAGPEGPPQEEPSERGFVKVRTTVALCSQSFVMQGQGGTVPITSANLREGITPKSFLYCRSPLDQEGLQ